MNEFDQWRAGYGTRTIGEEIAYHNELEARFPEQAHFNPMAAHTAFYTVWPSKVLEAGAWKGIKVRTCSIWDGMQSKSYSRTMKCAPLRRGANFLSGMHK